MSSEPGPAARLFAVIAYLLAVAGLAALGAYILLSGLGHWPRGETAEPIVAWVVNLGWLTLFAVQHSGMARQSFKDWLTRCIPPYLERSTYVAVSGLITLAQPLLWQPLPGGPVWAAPTWIVAISLAAAFGVGLCCTSYDWRAFLGLSQVGIGGPTPSDGALRTTGPYRWVRHPLMLGTLIFLWAQPMMPLELLLLNGGLTLYILAAIRLEERTLVRQFGSAYEEYRRHVPALVPWRRPYPPPPITLNSSSPGIGAPPPRSTPGRRSRAG
jgi:protein-S-isoprenylcysteine O-methyltransferase Ste14